MTLSLRMLVLQFPGLDYGINCIELVDAGVLHEERQQIERWEQRANDTRNARGQNRVVGGLDQMVQLQEAQQVNSVRLRCEMTAIESLSGRFALYTRTSHGSIVLRINLE